MKSALIIIAGWLIALGTLFAQNVLPPGKQAIEDQYTQERKAGAQNPAPKNPNAPYPTIVELPFDEGISDSSDAPFSSEDVAICNHWQGIRNGVETIVYTGAESDEADPQQGVVITALIPDYPAEPSAQRILTPVKGGKVCVVAAQNGVLTLVSTSGHYVLTFNINTGTFTNVVVDNTAPTIAGMPAPGCTLWPANQKLVQVATINASDDTMVAPGTFKVTATSNQPIPATDPMYPDIVVTPTASGGYTVQLRADRLGNVAADRVYSINATAADIVGNTANVTATCTVPHDQGKG